MAENQDKDVPIKEQDDGSVLAKVEVPENFDEEDTVEVDAQDVGELVLILLSVLSRGRR